MCSARAPIAAGRHRATDVLGYVRTLAWGPAAQTEPEPQDRAIRSWAEARGHRLVAVLHDELVPGSEDLPHRLRLARALDMFRDGSAETLVVARLDRLDDDPVMQERLIAEIRARGGTVVSAQPDEETELGDQPADVVRVTVRRVLATSGDYERAMRELRVRNNVARTGVPRDGLESAMATIEELAPAGASVEEIASRLRAAGFLPGSGHFFGRAWLRRVLANLSPPDVTKEAGGSGRRAAVGAQRPRAVHP